MKYLFLHPNFPAQYRNVAAALGRDPDNTLLYGTENRNGEIAGVQKVYFKPARDPGKETHHYVRPLEKAVLAGQAVFRTLQELKAKGFVPDVICGHSGWGTTQFVKDIYPDTPMLCFFEWFYRSIGSDADFLHEYKLDYDDMARIRTKNASILIDIASCDWGVTPTRWQMAQFPPLFQRRITELHEGIDTEFLVPSEGARLNLPELDLSGVDELVTYVARGMEPYRGFPQVIETLAILLERRPELHAVIVGADRVAYGRQLPDGATYKQKMLAEVPLDPARVHFTGLLPFSQYLQVLQASSVHVYLTVPFVLSWSMMEAMSAGCLVVGSDTEPVREMIEDGVNGLLVDFFSPEAIAERVIEVLEHPDRMAEVRARARATIVERYPLSEILPRQIALIHDVAARRLPPHAGNLEAEVAAQ